MVSADGKTGKTDSNRDESATNRNHEPVGELARAWRHATHSGRGPSRQDAMPSANMPPGWRGLRIAAREQNNVMSECNQFVGQPRNNALGASIKLRRNGLSQRGYLRDLHAQSYLEIRLDFARCNCKTLLRAQSRAGRHAAAIARTSI